MSKAKLSKKERDQRLLELRRMSDGAEISTADVAILLGVSIPAARGYKNAGIIEPVDRQGMGDVYLLSDILWAIGRLKTLRGPQGLTIAKSGATIRAEREAKRVANN